MNSSDAFPPSRRVTIRDLAARLGLSNAAVSMALRNHPNIAKETRLRVKEEADRCGYRPEPMLSALASYRQQRRPATYHGTLAWVINENTGDPSVAPPLFDQYFEGACQQAGVYGFQIGKYVVQEPSMSPARLSDILLARGIQGVLVAPQPRPNCRLEMCWERFSAVTFGFTLLQPQLHLVSSTQYRNSRATTYKMQELGYQRIGFFSHETFDARTDGNFTAGFQTMSLRMPISQRIPPLLLRETDSGSRHLERIRKWITRWRVDAIVCVGGLQEMLIQAGYRVPDDFAVALHSYQHSHPFFAGVDELGVAVGAAAVDSVVGMIHRGERGVPAVPHLLLIEGKWVDGPSAPPAALRNNGTKAKSSKPVALLPRRKKAGRGTGK